MVQKLGWYLIGGETSYTSHLALKCYFDIFLMLIDSDGVSASDSKTETETETWSFETETWLFEIETTSSETKDPEILISTQY